MHINPKGCIGLRGISPEIEPRRKPITRLKDLWYPTAGSGPEVAPGPYKLSQKVVRRAFNEREGVFWYHSSWGWQRVFRVGAACRL